MSLAFQSGDTIKMALYEELHNLLSPVTEIRVSAEGRMKQLEITEGYGVFLAELIMNQSFDLAMRQLAAVMLTRYVENHWNPLENDIKVVATDQAKRMIRNILPNGLYDPNSKIRTAVAFCISNIASLDWPTTWTELFDIIVKCLGGNEDSVHGAMQVLIEFTYDLDTQITDVGPIIISEVYRIFEAEKVYNVKTRTCAVKIFKSLFKSINEHVETKAEQDKLLLPILPSLIEKLMLALTNPDPMLSSFTLKTEVIKVLSYLVNNMRSFINQYTMQILPPIWQLLTQTADVYVKVIVNRQGPNPFDDSEDDEEEANFVTMILQIIEFIHSLVESGKFKAPIKAVLSDLMYIMIVYMQLTEEQLELWADDPDKFIDDDYQEHDGQDGSIRISSQDVLRNIACEFEQVGVVAALREALSRHVNVADAEKANGSQHWWKIHEASISAVGAYKELILKHQIEFDLSNYLHYVRNCTSEKPYLIARCLWVLCRFANSDIYNAERITELMTAIQTSLAVDQPLNMRVYAVRSIYELCDSLKETNDERRGILVPKLIVYLDGMIGLLPSVKNSVLCLLLETLYLMLSFDSSFTVAASPKVTPLTIAIFLKHHDDPYVLENVQDILKLLCKNRFCLEPLQVKLIPALVSIFNLNGEHTNNAMQENALDILTTLVKYSEAPLSDLLIENAFPAAVHCILRTDDHSVMQSGGECMRAYIYVSPQQICSFKNGEGLNYIMQISTNLLNPMSNEFTATFVGRLIITIISRAGNLIGDNIYLLLKAVISKMQLVESLSVSMSLVMIYAHLFVTQMEAVLNFLSTVPGPTGEPAIQYVFSNWLSRQQLFYGTYERKVSTLALCKLFEHGVTTRDARLMSVTIRDCVENESSSRTRQLRSKANQQVWHDVPILVKIFKLLISELSHLRETHELEDSNSVLSDEDDGETPVDYGESSARDLDLDDENGDDDDDQLMQDLMQDPIFQSSMEEMLTKFLQNFSREEHFREFVDRLNNMEKQTLRNIEVTV